MTLKEYLAQNTVNHGGGVKMTLDLSWNDLEDGDLEFVFDIAQELSCFDTIILSSNRIGIDCGDYVSKILLLDHIKFLDLCENRFSTWDNAKWFNDFYWLQEEKATKRLIWIPIIHVRGDSWCKLVPADKIPLIRNAHCSYYAIKE